VTFSPKEPEKPARRKARHTYLVFARGVIGETNVDYTTLYQRFAPNDWAAIKPDDGVALAALKSGCAAKAVVSFLHQSPYVQHQVQKALPALGQAQGIQNSLALERHLSGNRAIGSPIRNVNCSASLRLELDKQFLSGAGRHSVGGHRGHDG
jgi:hypothetical protein